MTRLVKVVVIGALLSSCGGDSTGSAPDFTITADPPAATTLGTANTLHVHLNSTGASGTVTFDVTGAPANWTITPPAGAVTLAANGQTTADLTVTIPSNGDAAAAGQTLTIAATIGSQTHQVQPVLTVANTYVATLVLGGGSAGGHWGALALTTIHLNVGTMLRFHNADTTAHLIHAAGGVPGVVHQNTGGIGTPAGGNYDQTIAGTGSDVINCHNHGPTGDLINIAVP